MPPCPNFSTLAIKLVHSARTKVTFFRISVHLASQYLSLFVYKSRHCMPRMPALCVLIKFKLTVPAGLEWKKKKSLLTSGQELRASYCCIYTSMILCL